MITQPTTNRLGWTSRGQAIDWAISTALFVSAVALRLPVSSQWLINWDAVQFALGTQQFDLAHHQPHPPGYLVYVLWGALLNQITHDPNTSLVATSIAAGSMAVVVLYRWALGVIGRPAATIAAVLFATSPLLWYYSSVALTYAVEAFFALLVLALFWKCVGERQEHLIVPASAVLGIAAGVRQTTLLFLFPLWVWTILHVSQHLQIRAIRALTIACAVWLLPLLVLSGGADAYFTASLELAALIGQSTSVLYAGPVGGISNLAVVVGTVIVALNVSLLGFLVRRRNGSQSAEGADEAIRDRRLRRFGMLWIAPPLFVFVLGHIGQPGYLLLVLPGLYLALAPRLVTLGQVWLGQSAITRQVGVAGLTALLVLGNVITYFGVPLLAYQVAPEFAAKVDVRENDRFWRQVVQLIRSYPPDQTVILTGVDPRSSFRHAGFYLPDYPVYAVGRDLAGHYGYLFRSFGGVSDYSVGGLHRSSGMIELPTRVRYVFILDAEIADTVALPDRTQPLGVTAYRTIYHLQAPELHGIAFVDGRMYLVSRVLVHADSDDAGGAPLTP